MTTHPVAKMYTREEGFVLGGLRMNERVELGRNKLSLTSKPFLSGRFSISTSSLADLIKIS